MMPAPRGGSDRATLSGFSLFDVSGFPTVRARMQGQPPGYGPAWAAEMDALMRHGQPFVIVLLDEHGEESHEDRKTKSVWIKANKATFVGLCRGFITVVPDRLKRLAMRAQGAVIAASFGLRFAAVRDVPEAEQLAARLLAGEPLPDIDD